LSTVDRSAQSRIRTVALFTQADPDGVADGVRAAAVAAEKAGSTLVCAEVELGRLGISSGVESCPEPPESADLCLVLGGDGTILRALRYYAHKGVPVFAINFGTVGFLATVDRDQLESGLALALAGDFDVMSLPSLSIAVDGGERVALNDISFTRRPHGRVAELAYRLAADEVGHVRCDGLVAATPAGSTGYNLANGGPILAWGVEGYVVSFVAPHTLTARSLVVAPTDVLHVRNAASREAVDVSCDGEAVRELGPGEELAVGFSDDVSYLAQLPGANFYHRIREKFGRLA
jgi:NAD+ kinase